MSDVSKGSSWVYTQSSSSLSRQSDRFLVILIDLIENNSKRHFASFVFMSITARIAESPNSKSWHGPPMINISLMQ